ncbi:hypothetical protein MJO29_003009 [Puccinia striiformis f. sp. tritici]|nr:hypothetical protein MJO29_003009 [Puccinia striiformis f. sp. tritici]
MRALSNNKEFFRTKNIERPIRLRFTPSPTRFLRLGGLRAALFNHLMARKLGGKWILRIKDIDQSRSVDGAVENVIKTLKWAKLDYDEGPNLSGKYGPYIQSQRQTIYKEHIDQLLKSKHAYQCFCSADRLKHVRREGSDIVYDRKCLKLSSTEVQEKLRLGESHVVRLKNPDNLVSFDDLIYGRLKFINNDQDDMVLFKADGTPTSHFAEVVDDHLMAISHVLRGEECISSTPKQILLYNALGFPLPKFAHLPLLVNQGGTKLNTRSGDVRVEDYISKGYEPEALLNFVALMGMNHYYSRFDKPTTIDDGIWRAAPKPEVMRMEQMISAFPIEVNGKHCSILPEHELVYLNQQHISSCLLSSDPEEVQAWIQRARLILDKLMPCPNEISDAYVHCVLLALVDKIHVFNDMKHLAKHFFCGPDLNSSEAKEMRKNMKISDLTYYKILEASCEALKELPDLETDFTREKIREIFLNLREEFPATKGQLIMSSLQHAITGQKIAPGMAETIEILGKRKTCEYLQNALLQ